jgi:hypothetical protein
MKFALSQRLLLMPRKISWWVWAITALCLAAGLKGHAVGFVAAIFISVAQTVVVYLAEAAIFTFPVQVRLAYTGLLIVCQVPSLSWLYWVPTMGDVCSCTLWILPDGTDSVAFARKPR